MIDKIETNIFSTAQHSVMLPQLTFRSRPVLFPDCAGLTLVELIVVVAVLGILAVMALPSYNSYIKTVKKNAAASDLRTIDKAVTAFFIDRNFLPPSLEAVGMENQLDPWKRRYEYQILDGVNVPLQDISGEVLNHDYDLYSKGEDGASSPLLGDPENVDDISRSNDGAFVGGRP